ncbi:MAG: 30S ribosomal protein S6 [Deltaproteobacteria bacterium]|nr:30S ribosomal protein S6 [Deltaproteobacteria bacterium]
MREYETIFILRPELAGDAVDAFNARMKEVVTTSGGKVIRLSNWGKKRLAYRLKKCSRGTYVHLLYLADGRVVAELERNLRLSDNVIRHLSVLLAKDVDPATRQTEADVRMRGDAEDEGVSAPPALAAQPAIQEPAAPKEAAAAAAAAPAEAAVDEPEDET